MSRIGPALLLALMGLPALAQAGPPVLAVEPALARYADDLAAALGGTEGRAPLAATRAPAIANSSQALRAVRAGTATLALVPLATLQRISSLYAFDQIPFFTGASGEHAWLLVAAARPFVEKRLEEEGLALLALLPEPPVGLWLDQPDDADVGQHRIEPQTAAERRVAELLALRIGDGPVAATAPRARFAPLAASPDGSATGVSARALHATRPLIALIANRGRRDAMAPDDRQSLEASARRIETGEVPPRVDVPPLPRAFVAAGERMAEEWAIATGADGHQILAEFRKRLITVFPSAPHMTEPGCNRTTVGRPVELCLER